MTEVGLVRYAEVAIEVASKILPLYRASRSKHISTQPQLLSALLLMRYEDWTFRETEVRLKEHAELRKTLGLTKAPAYPTLYRFMRRLDESTLEQALTEACRRVGPPPTGDISTYFVKKTRTLSRKHDLKWVISIDTFKQAIAAQIAHAGPTNDTASLPGLVEKTRAG